MSERKPIRMMIAGGGTGGHIFPAVAIGHAMRRMHPGSEILFVGAKGRMEMDRVPQEGFPIEGLDIAGFDRGNLLKNITLPWKLIKSFLQARSLIRRFRPDVAVGVGGYASFPVLYIAQRMGIPTLIQEQNSFAGKSNTILGKKARSVCVAYDGMEKFFPREVLRKTGNPVRQTIATSALSREEGIRFFGLKPEQPVVFVFGGSLGAKSINDTLKAQYRRLLDAGAQLIWQTGKTSYAEAREAVKGFEDRVLVFDFIREMDLAYAAADIIVSRSGASSISELCIVGKPVIFVPFPYASEDHQTHNAMALVSADAALMVRNADTETELVPQMLKLLSSPSHCRRLAEHISPMAIKDADVRIAEEITRIART
jgi:UDP-N-acetylglucosamine--N-acetylmuramyl-(pentapeptide) pyrophosphoryl-undecaprenol N-acetylglucosamine transferase